MNPVRRLIAFALTLLVGFMPAFATTRAARAFDGIHMATHKRLASRPTDIQDGVRLKYLTPISDPAFQNVDAIKPSPETRALAILPASPWRPVTVTWPPVSMTNPWVPYFNILASTNLTAWTLKASITNPWPMREWMSNGVYHSEFINATNYRVTFAGQPQEFFYAK